MLFMYPSKKIIRRSQGLGLTDLMVGLAIGLLATLVIIKVAVLFEARRKSTTGIADAQMNASYALANLSRDVRMAGHGLGPSEALGCSVRRTLDTTVLPDWVLWPVTIIDGVDGASDTLLVLSSGKAQSLTAARLIAPYTVSSDVLMVNSTLGMMVGDTLLLHESGNTQCPLIKVTGIPIGDYRIRHDSLPAGLLTATAYQEGAAVINLGAIHHQRYTINAKNQLLLERYDVTTDKWKGSAFASDVISLQAQLGYDARTTLSGALRVTRWSAAAFDANANGTAGDADDFRRVLAIRIAVVSRSAQRSDQGCSSAIPTWRAANESTGVMEDTPIAVNTIQDWACYRYRVLQAEIPLRNMIWSDS
jgi:type IV pilus assembly protein PilW